MRNSFTHSRINPSTFIIAEAGVNHNGDITIARRLIDVAVETSADAVKFQMFNAEKMISRYAPMAEYQKKSSNRSESQLEMIKKYELDIDSHRELRNYCEEKGIIFLSSPFDLESIDLLDRLGLKIFKIPSGEITNLPYLRKIGSLKKKIIMSTGMANLAEIKNALNVLINAGTTKKNITVLHCNTEYPTPFEDVNLRAMISIRDSLNVNVGYSDHTPGIEVPVAAVAMGATVIEKHFTLDKNMDGPDHKASLEPHELKNMIIAIRNIEKAVGNRVKQASLSEMRNKEIARKSIVALRNIKEGEIFTGRNITTKRPGTGISPMEWDKVIGKHAKRGFKKDEVIRL